MTTCSTSLMPKMTTSRLAVLVQKEFHAIHGRIDALEKDTQERFEYVYEKLRSLEASSMQMFEMITEMRDMMRGFAYAPEIDDLRGRVARLEKKIGL